MYFETFLLLFRYIYTYKEIYIYIHIELSNMANEKQPIPKALMPKGYEIDKKLIYEMKNTGKCSFINSI